MQCKHCDQPSVPATHVLLVMLITGCDPVQQVYVAFINRRCENKIFGVKAHEHNHILSGPRMLNQSTG